MPPLPPNIMQGRWLRWWLTLSFAVMFSGTFLFNSRIGLLNVLDVLFFLPSLTLLTRAIVSGDYRLMASPLLVPLYLLLGWALLSMAWADEPNTSRTVRGVVQIVVMVGIFRWLHMYFRNTFRQAMANGALMMGVIAGLLALRALPISEYPEVVPPTVVVRAQYPGANPRVIAETVAEERTGAAQGIAFFANGFTMAAVTLVSGPLYENLGVDGFYVMAVIAAVLHILVHRTIHASFTLLASFRRHNFGDPVNLVFAQHDVKMDILLRLQSVYIHAIGHI